jgi:SAM-dependent methyltransferase
LNGVRFFYHKWKTAKQCEDHFLNPCCTPDTLDNSLIRSSILCALKRYIPDMQGILLDVGCGKMPYKPLLISPQTKVTQYIGLDFDVNPIHRNTPDITWQKGKIPLVENSVDCVLCTEVFEHCPEPEVVMREIHRVLKPGGFLFFTVPFLWPLHEVPYDHYRYTPFTLERHLTNAGFSTVQLEALGGWHASLAQMLGLWARRGVGGYWKRMLFSVLLWPVVCLLARLDKPPHEFKEGTMITGIAGVAVKVN